MSDSQVQAIQKHLETLRESRSQGSLSHLKGALQTIQSATGSNAAARELYEKCYREIYFPEALGTREKDFRDWQNENDRSLGFEPFLAAVRLQLEYLILTVRASRSDKLSSVLGDLSAFIRKIVALKEPLHPFLNEDVSDTVFVKAMQLQDALCSDEGWADNPLAIGQMYDKIIFPCIRLESPASLETVWAERMQQEMAMAQKYLDLWKKMEPYLERSQDESRKADSKDKLDNPALIAEFNKLPTLRAEYSQMARFAYNKARSAERFFKDGFPQLRWNQLQDSYQYGPKSARATIARSMLDYIEKNLTHPSATSWMDQMTALTSGKAATSGTPGAPDAKASTPQP